MFTDSSQSYGFRSIDEHDQIAFRPPAGFEQDGRIEQHGILIVSHCRIDLQIDPLANFRMYDPFQVTPSWHPDEATCRLVSAAVDDEDEAGLARSGITEAVGAALAAGLCRKLIWDHSAVADWTAFVLWRKHYVLFGVGAHGAHTFQAMSDLCRESAGGLGNVAAELLSERISALQSWRRLRPIVVSLVLPLMLVHYTIRLITLPWRTVATFYRVQPIFRSLLVLGLLADVPVLRGAVTRYLLRPWLWLHTAPMSVFADLGRLGLLRCLRGSELNLEKPFTVTAQWDGNNHACRLVSAASNKDDAVRLPSRLSDELRGALTTEQCQQLVWDHSAVGDR